MTYIVPPAILAVASKQEPSTESLMRGSWKKRETRSSDARRLEGVIEVRGKSRPSVGPSVRSPSLARRRYCFDSSGGWGCP